MNHASTEEKAIQKFQTTFFDEATEEEAIHKFQTTFLNEVTDEEIHTEVPPDEEARRDDAAKAEPATVIFSRDNISEKPREKHFYINIELFN